VVAVAGSRRLPPGGAGLVSRAAVALCGSGFGLSVGCCRGADALALSAVAGLWSGRVACLAAFAPCGAGASPFSAVAAVRRAVSLGVAVSWLAGGPLSLPLAARLSRRTRAVVGKASAGCVVFFASPHSAGSRLAAGCAVARGLPVLAFPLGFPGAALPAPGSGSWQPSGLPGLWAAAWRWVPDQSGLL
jgi:hypothetical protein